MILDNLDKTFTEVFKEEATQQFFTPGRINLIGEHIDYSGGFVFPCAITYGTYAKVRKRNDRTLRLYSDNFKELGVLEFSLDDLVYDVKDDWTNYPKGVAKMMLEAGYDLQFGCDIAFVGNIPNGAGLSSSASLEVLTALILDNINNLNIDRIELVKLSQRAENVFVGVNCGIMDQFAVGMGLKDQAMLLNTDTLAYEYIPVALDGHSIVIMNTNKRRGLMDSAYNERREQCEQALKILQSVRKLDYLCDYSMEDLTSNADLFTDELVYKRAHHAISENIRTKEAAEVLKQKDLITFGKLMNESHVSLRDDYDVTGIELDTVVGLAWGQEGVLGARVTGAGFGGCALAIVKDECIDSFIESVGKAYLEAISYEATFYVASIGEGAHEII